MDKRAIGLNWWATRRWKIGADYGLTELDRFGKSGTTQSLHMRMQWIY
jgi:phosphate-selective porin OprO and OprP